jgi:hypothetical protein
VADRLAEDWRTSAQQQDITIVTVGLGPKPMLTLVLAADGTARLEHHLDGPAWMRVTRDGPSGYRSEARRNVPPYNAVALLAEEESTDD